MLPRRVGLRWIVVALTLSILAPLGFVSVVSMQRTSRRILTNVNRQGVATVHAISVAIDTEIETTTAALDVLATLHALDAPDLTAFRTLAGRLIIKQPDWSAIQLADLDGRLLETSPPGAPFNHEIVAQWARNVGAARRPFVSSLYEVPNLPGHFLTIAVPIVRDGGVTLALGAQVKPDAFSGVLRRQHAPLNGVVALLDPSDRVVARSKDQDAYVGMTAPIAFAELSSRVPEGSWQTTNRDGVPVYSAYSRSPLTGMTVGLAVPKEEVDGPVRRIMWMLAAAWTVMLAFGASVAIVFGRVIVRAMRSASSAAMALARGERVEPARSRIAEIDDLATGLREAAATLETRNRERDEAGRLKDEFLMTVSHELRTPLTAIYGWARMLATGNLRAGQQATALKAIERNSKALEQLVNDLLDVSRVVSGRLRLEVQPVFVRDAVAAAVETIRPAALAKTIEVAVRAKSSDLFVSGDPARLQQIVWNLLSNAVRFTPAGGRIDVELDRRDDTVTIVVRDTGPGIDPGFLPHVFERFRQGVSGTTRAHGGLGLGLAIVRHLVELHGGSIEAGNAAPGPGAVFRVTLPARMVERRAPAADMRPLPHGDTQRDLPTLDGVSVLVADDDLDSRELIVELLETAGAEARAASSADDALMILEGWTPDVLLSDIEMPGEDGYALMRKVRLSPAGRQMTSIALTAHARPEDRLAALDAGFAWHLGKPIDPAELVQVIATLIQARTQEPQSLSPS